MTYTENNVKGICADRIENTEGADRRQHAQRGFFIEAGILWLCAKSLLEDLSGLLSGRYTKL